METKEAVKDDRRRPGETVTIRLTALEERKAIERAAARQKMTVSSYCRNAILASLKH